MFPGSSYTLEVTEVHEDEGLCPEVEGAMVATPFVRVVDVVVLQREGRPGITYAAIRTTTVKRVYSLDSVHHSTTFTAVALDTNVCEG